jgi:hypothetical protein
MAINNRNDSASQGNLNRAMEFIVRDLSEALKGVEEVAAGSTCTQQTCPSTCPAKNVCIVDDTSITFKVPESRDADGTVHYKTIQFSYSSSTKEITKTETDSMGVVSGPIIVGRKLQQMAITKNATNENLINLALTASDAKVKKTQVYLRNVP